METEASVLRAKTPWELLAEASSLTRAPRWVCRGGAWDARWHRSLPQPPGTRSWTQPEPRGAPPRKIAGGLEPSPEDPTPKTFLAPSLWSLQHSPELGCGPGWGSQREPRL